MKKKIGLWLGPLLAVWLLFFAELDPTNPAVTRCAVVAVWMAVWWVTEAIPIPATALLPVALFPALGVLKGSVVAAEYFNHIIFLFIGGFIVALAMEKWNLHRRIALTTILLIGSGSQRIVFGFMAATFFLSMWVSNTATTMMMVPMALAIIHQLRKSLPDEAQPQVKRFAVALLIGIAYSASIGGTATLIGTPPNLVLASQLEILFPNLPEISFTQWLVFALPFALVFLVVAWRVLVGIFLGKGMELDADITMFRKERRRLGKMSYEEKVISFAFVALALLWIFRKPIHFGGFITPGWSELFPIPGFVDDGVVAIAVALALFVIPSRARRGERMMDWTTAAKLNWGIVILFGGGFALAEGFVQSGLSGWLGAQLTGLSDVPGAVFVVSVSSMMTFLTELTSNTASTQMILPVLGAFAQANHIAPLLLFIPATLSASCAFMLPVATPPNAIVFGSGEIEMWQMMKAGLLMNLVGIVLIFAVVFSLGGIVFGLG